MQEQNRQLQQALASDVPVADNTYHFQRLLFFRRSSEWLLTTLLMMVSVQLIPSQLRVLDPTFAIALILLFWRGARVVLGIACGVFLAFMIKDGMLSAGLWALVFSISAWLCFASVQRLIGPLIPMNERKAIAGFLILVAGFTLCAHIIIAGGSVSNQNLSLWLASLIGVVLITPAFLIWGHSVQLPPLSRYLALWALANIAILTWFIYQLMIVMSQAEQLGRYMMASLFSMGLLARIPGMTRHVMSMVLLGVAIIMIWKNVPEHGPIALLVFKQWALIMIGIVGLIMSSSQRYDDKLNR